MKRREGEGGTEGAKSMDLILMRHGKAEEGQPHLPDRERRLTEQGAERAAAAARVLKERLLGSGTLHIWSSPLRRAKETADILAAENGVAIREVTAIAQGDLDALADLWQEFSSKDTLIIVGHEPDMGLWSARLANVVLPFRPGAAAAFKLVEQVPPQGRLLWFVQPMIWAKM
ncbi:SixA phosphatase family protein [Azotosporobacter soli]|uniref:SixA phosphatase family protein n=1 Tax=Azotosporobacter soli TaxID=3055040 RepID=UPI0031FE6FD3